MYDVNEHTASQTVGDEKGGQFEFAGYQTGGKFGFRYLEYEFLLT